MISFKQFIAEMGGWSKTITQDTKLTPEIAKKALSNMPKFERDFNAYLKAHDYAPIKIGKPIGSTAYLERDLKDNPEKEYGDIDIIFTLPRIEGTTESKNQSIYKNLVVQFIEDEKPSYIYDGGSENGTNITVSIGNNKWAQVDLVAAFYDTVDWTTARMTPEHNLKGALLGFLYSTLSEILHVSIGTAGVQVKHVGDEIVPFKKLKVDSVKTISTRIGTFGIHILEYLYNHMYHGKGEAKIAKELALKSGMRADDIKFSDLAGVVRGLAKSFTLNDMWGKGVLKDIPNEEAFISKVKSTYIAKAEDAANASKFDKAATPDAKKRAEATKEMFRSKSKELISNL